MNQTIKISPIAKEPSVAVAVLADEENVIPTKNSFDDADDEDLEFSSSSRTWSKCLIASAVAIVTVLAVAIALSLINNTRLTEDASLHMITFGMNNQSEDPYAMVLAGEESTETATSVARLMRSTITTSSSISPAQTTTTTTATTSPDDEGDATVAATTAFVSTTITANPCSACSISNGNNNFCGQLGIYTFIDACDSQTECEERGLQCIVCDSVEGYDGDVGTGAYICVEEKERDGQTEDDTTTTSTNTTITASTTGADDTTSTTTTTTDDTTAAPATTMTESSFNECSITNDEKHFRGQLGIYTFIDACDSQTDCEERGLQCIVCDSVEGYDGDVGTGAYICVEEEDATTTSTIAATTTTADDTTTTTTITTTTTTEASLGGIESLMGTMWEAEEIRWLIPTSEELKETTEEDRNPITLVFKSDTRVSGTCGNNRCSSVISLRDDRLKFGKFRRTKMRASEQEQNYVHLLEKTTFFYEVWEHGDGSKELDLYEIVVDDRVEMRGRKMATYFQMENV